MFFPKEEDRVGFRKLFDIYKAVFSKFSWIFKTSSSLWTDYMWDKCCKKLIPKVVQWKNGSQIWKKVLEATDIIDQDIWWELTVGYLSIWFDNWIRLGTLYYVVGPNFYIK